MASSFPFKLVSPQGKLYEGNVDFLTVPGEYGSIGVLAGHAPMLASLRTGVMSVVVPESGTSYYAVSAGLLEIADGGAVILADNAFAASSEHDAATKTAEWLNDTTVT